jgi:ubiquinone/menaquinone biosynthesis C-methylase UbiE
MIKAFKIIYHSLHNYLIYDNGKIRKNWVINKLANIQHGQTILDAGAGELQYSIYCDHLKYTSQDFGEYDGAGNNLGLQTNFRDNSKLDIKSDIVHIPVDDASFDNLLCIEVLEHVPYPIKAIKEFSRILKPGGNLILTAPFNSLTHYAPFYFYNGFSRYFYEKILLEHQFEIIEIKMNGNYFDYISGELGRIPSLIHKFKGCVVLRFIYILLIIPILFIIKLMGKNSKHSDELLTTGIHIYAKKI